MRWRLCKALVILPGTVLVVVPLGILWLAAGSWYGAAAVSARAPSLWLGLAVGLGGLGLFVWTLRLFTRDGRGTPAPWDPPRHLVVAGPYRHVRNPMISSVLLVLAAEAAVTRSPALGLWAILFLVGNAAYQPLVEEPALEARFGEAYRAYKARVPRWIPRLRPWRADRAAGALDEEPRGRPSAPRDVKG